MDELKNFRALNDFLTHWNSEIDFETPRASGMPTFIAMVTYRSRSRCLSVLTKIRVSVTSGPEDGEISIEATPKLSPDHFHLQFLPAFQDYTYEEDSHALVISGKSAKMGDYVVQVVPVNRPS